MLKYELTGLVDWTLAWRKNDVIVILWMILFMEY